MFEKKWCTFKPIGYVGMVLVFIGLFVANFLNTNSGSIKIIGMLMFIIGLSLIFKGRKEHGL